MAKEPEWEKVVFSFECDEDGNCPVCKTDFAECPCIGPTEDDVEYKEDGDVLYGRRIESSDGSTTKD